jgi:hypothetical protein
MYVHVVYRSGKDRTGLVKPLAIRPLPLRVSILAGLTLLALITHGSSLAAPVELGRLFYTPAQRAQLETARSHHVTQIPLQTKHSDAPDRAPAPVRFDGVVMRSDGKTTRWVDGKPEVGTSSVSGLKPGQIRASGKVYEPYQVLRPVPPSPDKPDTPETEP